MAAPRHYLPLFLLSIFALFFYSYYHSSLHTPNSIIPYHNHTFKDLQNPNPNPIPNFTLTIKLLAYDRLDSLSRCLRSLANADYGDDRVNLHIYIDHFPYKDSPNEDLAALDKKLDDSHRILEFVDGFVWNYGEKLVHYRTANVGLQAQWLEAWWPLSDNDFAFVVEDDLEVSQLYYKFLRGLIVNYYYNATNFNPSIYGASLQRPRFVPGKHGNKMNLESGKRLFLYQLVGTWGQLLFPKPWKEFRLWYDTHKAKGIKPFLQGMVTTGWYKKMGERIWTPWFIQFIHSRGYFNIYTNFLHERALSISHRDAGVNYGKTAGPDSYLLNESSLDFNLLEMQSLSTLQWYDFCFREVLPGRIVRSYNELETVLYSVQKQETVVLVSLYRVSDSVLRNLVCHFERLNIWNYVFIGKSSNFLHDLARRGHPVIDADQFFESIRGFQSMQLQESHSELVKEILVKDYVVKRCLESRYSSLLVDGNMVFNSSDLYVHFSDSTYDFYAGKMTEFFFVRSSSYAQKIWGGSFMNEAAAMVMSSMHKGLLTKDEGKFVNLVTSLLEKKGVRIKRIDETSIGVKIDTNNVAQTSPWNGQKMFFWSSDLALSLIQRRLKELDCKMYRYMQYEYQLGQLYISHPRNYFPGIVKLENMWREVKFVVFAEEESQLAIDIFKCTSKVSHRGILKPWFYTHDQVNEVWFYLICYDNFSHLMMEYQSLPQPFSRQKMDQVVHPWWCENIRLLLESVHYIHENNLLHMGLLLDTNYVIVNGGIKILNIQSSVSEQCYRRRNPQRGVMEKRDMQALRNKLRDWLQSVPLTLWHDAIIDERDAFLEYFYGYNDEVYQKLLKHPFLKGAYDRFAVIFEIKRSELAYDLVSPSNWNIFRTRLASMNQYDSWRELTLPEKLLDIYQYEVATYEDGPYELVKFLRNVYVHLQEPPAIPKIEKDVMALYPGFFTRIYQAFPHIGTNII